MTAVELLAELDAAGIAVVREGDDLRVRGKSGAVTPFAERIRELKPELLAALGDDPCAERRPNHLSDNEARALGLDPTLRWVRVYTGSIEPTRPPVGGDGALPAGCGWPSLCRQLGPCPRNGSGGPCRLDRTAS